MRPRLYITRQAGRPLLAAAAALTLASCGAAPPSSGGVPDAAPAAQTGEERRSAAGRDLARECCPRVVDVIDGDTVRVATVGSVRLIGVDTPERGRCYFAAATRFTARRLAGRRVGLRYERIRRDPWHRTLAYVHDRGHMHNAALVRRGYAEALTIPLIATYAEGFETAEAEARRRGVGQWSECRRAGRDR